MGRGDGVVRVVGPLRAAEDVAPPGADVVAGFDGDNSVGLGAVDAAGELGVVDVVDGVGLGGGAEANEGGLLDAVDGEFLGTGLVFRVGW